MTPGGLRNLIAAAVRRDVGLRLSELAEITGQPMADVKAACWAMCNMRRLDYCQGGFFVLPVPSRAPGQEPAKAAVRRTP